MSYEDKKFNVQIWETQCYTVDSYTTKENDLGDLVVGEHQRIQWCKKYVCKQ